MHQLARTIRGGILLGIALGASGCGIIGGKKTPAAVAMRESLRPVLASERLYYDDGPGYLDSIRIVVGDADTWRSVWQKATSSQPTRPSLPIVDFDRSAVLVVGAGRLSPGDRVQVDSISIVDNDLTAIVRTIRECQGFPGDAYPLEIVRVERVKGSVRFEERSERSQECS